MFPLNQFLYFQFLMWDLMNLIPLVGREELLERVLLGLNFQDYLAGMEELMQKKQQEEQLQSAKASMNRDRLTAQEFHQNEPLLEDCLRHDNHRQLCQKSKL